MACAWSKDIVSGTLPSSRRGARRGRHPAGVADLDAADQGTQESGGHADHAQEHAPRDGMQLHLETDEAGQGVLAVTVLVAGSAVQLQAFAAPKTMGIWAEIRGEIVQSIVAQGGTADIVDGPFGRELLTRMPQRGADGRTQFQPARFIGIDGPRWFLRAVVSGAGAADPTQVAPALAVSRGDAPMAPRDLLPLTLPVELSAAPEPPQEYVGKRRREDDLRPFDRGPEITEIH